MKDKLAIFFWKHLIPILRHIPILDRLTQRIVTRKLASIVVDSVNSYSKAMDMMNTDELKNNPLWQTACGLLAMLALVPTAIIYNYIKSMEKEAEKPNEVSI